jgi:blocked-early-in-transport protein 1
VTPPASGRSSPLQHYEPNGHRFADDLEGQNDEQLDGLSAKVKLLKDVRELQNTVHNSRITNDSVCADHNWDWERGPRVDETAQRNGASFTCAAFRVANKTRKNDAFAETSGILGGTFRRMNNMAARQGCQWLWYIVFLVVVFWFFIVVWWFRR